VRPGILPPEAGTAVGQLGTGAARGSLLMRLARQLTRCLETEDLGGGTDSYPLGLYCSWTRSEWQWCLNVLECDLLGHMFVWG
jgi:hypothetical protein